MKAHTAVQRRTGCRSSQQLEGLDASSLQPCLAQEHIKEVLQDGAELGHAGRWGAWRKRVHTICFQRLQKHRLNKSVVREAGNCLPGWEGANHGTVICGW